MRFKAQESSEMELALSFCGKKKNGSSVELVASAGICSAGSQQGNALTNQKSCLIKSSQWADEWSLKRSSNICEGLGKASSWQNISTFTATSTEGFFPVWSWLLFYDYNHKCFCNCCKCQPGCLLCADTHSLINARVSKTHGGKYIAIIILDLYSVLIKKKCENMQVAWNPT